MRGEEEQVLLPEREEGNRTSGAVSHLCRFWTFNSSVKNSSTVCFLCLFLLNFKKTNHNFFISHSSTEICSETEACFCQNFWSSTELFDLRGVRKPRFD